MLKDPRLEAMGQLVDWVEAHNARVVGGTGNERAAAFAREMELPGIAVSDAHSSLEVGVAYTVLEGDPSTPEGLLAALADAGARAGARNLLRAPLDAGRQGDPAGPRERPAQTRRRGPPAADRERPMTGSVR